MKIVLATYGSRGDVQPMLALALALQSKGHEVLLAAPPEKSDWARQLGCPFRSLGSDVTAFIDGMKNAHTLAAAFQFVSFLRNEIDVQFDRLPEMMAGADLAIGSSLVFAMATLAEYMGIAHRFIAFAPQLLPSGYHPFPAFKHQCFPRCFNRMTWQIAALLDKFNISRLINQKRDQMGLKPIQDTWRHVIGKHVIVASDRTISRVPPDVVDPACTQTGYMHLRQPDQVQPELENFLAAGPPPVYAGFGSMPRQDQIRILATVVEAARLSGQRAVIGKFWEEPSGFGDSDDIFFIKKYPHLMLFPRMAAVIHHGGAGTTAASAASGVPQIVVPHILDQYYWGHQVCRTNLGPKPIWRAGLSSKRLAAAIRECLSNLSMRRKAQEVSEIIKQQDSLELTVSAILNHY